MKMQKVGNCTYKNLKIAILALMALAKATNDFRAQFLSTKSNQIQNFIDAAKTHYSSFVAYCKKFILDSFLSDLAQSSTTHAPGMTPLQNDISLATVAKLINEKILSKSGLNCSAISPNSQVNLWKQFNSAMQAVPKSATLIAMEIRAWFKFG